jgi:predicted DNA-binding transcriptional regulator YafY
MNSWEQGGIQVTARMAKLDRVLTLVHALSEAGDGLTLDDMAKHLGVNRRTAERMRALVASHFELDEWTEDRRKRFRIRDSLRRVYTRPTAIEVAALQSEADARSREQAPQAALLASLLAKVKGALDDREKRRIDPDLDALVRLQRSRVPAGPAVVADPTALAAVQGAIMAGCCLEFDYLADGADQPRWRRVIPYGLVHGPITYLIGQMPDREAPPVPYRLDRMSGVGAANLPGSPPEDWDLDAWLAQSFGIWRE